MRVYYGDIHGQWDRVEVMRRTHPEAEEIVIVGDIGVGFNEQHDEAILEYINSITEKPFVRFIRGNHDDPAKIATFPGYIEDGTVEDGRLYVGGAWSIDGPTGRPEFIFYRTPGVNWWEDEELSDEQWQEIFAKLDEPYEDGTVADTIHTVISHDGPSSFIKEHVIPPHKTVYNTRTSDHLQELWEKLPNVVLWIFGHYHINLIRDIGETRFIVLPDNTSASAKIIEEEEE